MTSLFIKMDVIRCPVSAGLNFRGTKLSRMAVEPRKPRKFSTAKIKVHTVYVAHACDPWPQLDAISCKIPSYYTSLVAIYIYFNSESLIASETEFMLVDR